jgi:hypothetical protein
MAWFTAKNMLSRSRFIDAFIEISGLFLAYRVKEFWGVMECVQRRSPMNRSGSCTIIVFEKRL